jgi:hypothetical protein
MDGVERMGIEADHSNMCKFEHEGAPGYESVAEAILRYATKSPAMIRARWVEEMKSRRIAAQAEADEVFREYILESHYLYPLFLTNSDFISEGYGWAAG